MTLKHPKAPTSHDPDLALAPQFSLETKTIPRHALPDGEMPPDVAYQIVHDELMLDGNARLNVATFVSTWMEPQAEKLMIQDILPVLRELGLVTIFWDVTVNNARTRFDESGELVDGSFLAIDKFLDELVWMAETLRYGRENVAIGGVA